MYYSENSENVKEKEITIDIRSDPSPGKNAQIADAAKEYGFRIRVFDTGYKIFVPISKKKYIMFFMLKIGCSIVSKNYEEEFDE